MDVKGILGYLEAKLSDGVDVSKEYLGNGVDVTKNAAREFSGFNQMAREADEITRSLGLVYREQSPLPLPKDRRYGDVLPASSNAIAHAYMSAKLAQKYGVPAAKTFGDLRERILSPAKEDLADESWDVYRIVGCL